MPALQWGVAVKDTIEPIPIGMRHSGFRIVNLQAVPVSHAGRQTRIAIGGKRYLNTVADLSQRSA